MHGLPNLKICIAKQAKQIFHYKNQKLCIKLVSIKELYYDARPTKSQDLHCKTSKTDIPLQEDKKLCIKLVSIKELYYDALPTKSQDYYDINLLAQEFYI